MNNYKPKKENTDPFDYTKRQNQNKTKATKCLGYQNSIKKVKI